MYNNNIVQLSILLLALSVIGPAKNNQPGVAHPHAGESSQVLLRELKNTVPSDMPDDPSGWVIKIVESGGLGSVVRRSITLTSTGQGTCTDQFTTSHTLEKATLNEISQLVAATRLKPRRSDDKTKRGLALQRLY